MDKWRTDLIETVTGAYLQGIRDTHNLYQKATAVVDEEWIRKMAEDYKKQVTEGMEKLNKQKEAK